LKSDEGGFEDYYARKGLFSGREDVKKERLSGFWSNYYRNCMDTSGMEDHRRYYKEVILWPVGMRKNQT
jgi:hypothetical protein